MVADLKIVPVILAGGTGTRLWPLSRQSLPKQFLSLVSENTLYQDTLLRVAAPDLFHPPVVLTNADFRFFARRQAAELGIDATVVLEPVARDSGPAVLAAAAYVRERYGKDALVLALAADHVVKDLDAFLASARTAATVAKTGQIVTFGIKPSRPSTAYGYIKLGEALPDGGFKVARFVEKPDVETATRYVADGYLWNSGNFLFSAETLLSEGEAFVPKMVEAATQAVASLSEDIGFLTLGTEAFTSAPSQSIDFAIMERTKHAAVVEGDFGWSDIGAWNSVREVNPTDEDGNVTRGPVTLVDSRDSYVYSDSTLVAGIGLDNVAVVATDDAILVMPADRSQDVKALVTALRASHPREVDEHLRMHRPWGTYETICRGERFHVKKIVVNPGGKLSLQKHHHRAEHWVVVKGTAEVTLGNDVFTLNENESTYLPFGSVHRLANPGRIPLELIEVQTGSYLGEDDIVRIEDVYSRV